MSTRIESYITDHMLHDLQHDAASIWVTLALLFVATFYSYFARSSKTVSVEQMNMPGVRKLTNAGSPTLHLAAKPGTGTQQGIARDTVFIVPDISNYTRFIASDHIDTEWSQQIVFSLINAMIDAADKTLQLSKVEGDAVLFYTDACELSDIEIGHTILAIFKAFFDERRRLMEECSSDPRVSDQIADLDLKIFVHRGETVRFNFKGTIDHFGADVIILHKLMKNSIDSNRYVMVTDAAENSVSLPDNLARRQVEEKLEHVGTVRASVFSFPADSLKFNDTADDLHETAFKLAYALRRDSNNL